MTIMTWISSNVILVAIIIVVLFFIFRYLMSSGYFKKIGLDFDTVAFKKTIQDMQGGNDFFAPAKEEIKEDKNKPQDDFFNTNIEQDVKGGKI